MRPIDHYRAAESILDKVQSQLGAFESLFKAFRQISDNPDTQVNVGFMNEWLIVAAVHAELAKAPMNWGQE